jgi:hypothetical protein
MKKKVKKGQGNLPFGKEAKSPKPKHVQILRGLAIKLLNSGLTETEIINGEKVHYTYYLAQLMNSLGYDFKQFIEPMTRKGYLINRTKDPEPESYYICATLQEGKELKIKLAA